jgi:hypothetical protein
MKYSIRKWLLFCTLQLFQAGFLTLTMHGFHETKKKNKNVGNDLQQSKI